MNDIRYEYKVTSPMHPPPNERTQHGPMMDTREMEWWLNSMAEEGWEFVSYGATHWHQLLPQDWWIFRRRVSGP